MPSSQVRRVLVVLERVLGSKSPLSSWWDVQGIRAFLIAQFVKNPPAMQETLVWFLGWEDPLEKGMATHSRLYSPWGQTWLSNFHFTFTFQDIKSGAYLSRWGNRGPLKFTCLCKSRHLWHVLRMVFNCSWPDSRPQAELLMLNPTSSNQDIITVSTFPETES